MNGDSEQTGIGIGLISDKFESKDDQPGCGITFSKPPGGSRVSVPIVVSNTLVTVRGSGGGGGEGGGAHASNAALQQDQVVPAPVDAPIRPKE